MKRYRLSLVHGVTEDKGDACHHPATTSQPMVLASDCNAALAQLRGDLTRTQQELRKAEAERDRARAIINLALTLETFETSDAAALALPTEERTEKRR